MKCHKHLTNDFTSFPCLLTLIQEQGHLERFLTKKQKIPETLTKRKYIWKNKKKV